MVKKLLKHEFIYYSRSLLPIEAALVGIAIVLRFIQFFENNSSGYDILFGSSLTAFIIAIFVCIVMTFTVSIKRYYQNLFKAEGYLTFTLPVTEKQLIFTKLISAVCAAAFTLLAVGVSVMIATAGEMFIEICKAVGYLFGKAFEAVGFNAVLYVLEFAIFALVTIATEYMLFYACITLGQTAKKNRVAAAVGIYFAYYYGCQILATISMIIVTTISWNFDFLTKIAIWISQNSKLFIHIFAVIAIAVSALIGFVYYLITHKVMRKKLNIE